MNREEFQNKLGKLGIYAAENGNRMRAEEVKAFFEGMDLSEEQYQLIFAYLASRQVTVEGYIAAEKEEKEELPLLPEEEHFLQNYKQALGNLLMFQREKVLELCQVVEETGDDRAKSQLTELMLSDVLRLADSYRGRGMLLGDLVQEGNVGLMLALEMLGMRPEGMSALTYLRQEICSAMEQAVRENEGERETGNQVADKLNTLRDQIEKLSEELGEKISIEELSAFSDMSVEEIEELFKLAGETLGEESGSEAVTGEEEME